MYDAQRAKQKDTDRTQTNSARNPSWTQPSIQRAAAPNSTLLPLYTQAWGDQPPPWLRLSTAQQESCQEKPLQGQFETAQHEENTTGLADSLKAGTEQLSGLSLDDVHVHYNSAEPEQVQALAYTQGTDIHVGPGQEQHLAHEAWHVVQQKQGRVQPTMQAWGVAINDDQALEKEADMMGMSATSIGDTQVQRKKSNNASSGESTFSAQTVIQRTIANSEYSGTYASDIQNYANNLNNAVQTAWAAIQVTPLLGTFADLDGHTLRWVSLITEYTKTKATSGNLAASFGYAIESLSTGPLKPDPPSGLSVELQGSRGGTRPDVILRKGATDVAWLDITASKSGEHIFDKAGDWEEKNHAEITYPSIGSSNYLAMQTVVQGILATGSNPEINLGGIDIAEARKKAKEAKAALKKKIADWKVLIAEWLGPVLTKRYGDVPDKDLRRTQETIRIFNEKLGVTDITDFIAASIIQAVGWDPKTYGFITGSTSSTPTGLSLLQEYNPEPEPELGSESELESESEPEGMEI